MNNVIPDFENTCHMLAGDLSKLWKDMNFDGKKLWELLKQKEIKGILGLKVINDGVLNIGPCHINVKTGGIVVYYPPNTDLKNDHFSKFYCSLSEADQKKFMLYFNKQVTDFFVKMIGKKIL